MRISQASDFALRILMLLGHRGEPLTVDAISSELKLAKSHVMKIIAKLVRADILVSTRGRNGGVALNKQPVEVSVGEIVRLIENDFAIVECMQEGKSSCTFINRCRLRGVMNNATLAFLAVLDAQSLQSIIDPSEAT